MRKFLISTETTSDLSDEIYNKLNIYTINMKYMVDEKEYGNSSSLTIKEFFDKMREGAMTKTSAVNEFDAKTYFEKLLENKQDILHIAFSSGLSSSCATIKRVAEELNKTNENKIYVVDSLCACTGQGLLVHLTAIKADNGENIEKVVKYVEDIKLDIQHVYTVDDLKYLVRGGRVSKIKGAVANLLNIKPALTVNNTGHLVQLSTVVSRKKALITLSNLMKENYTGVSNLVYIAHADCLEDAEFLKRSIENKIENTNIEIVDMGYVIGSHAGPGTIALFYLGKNRHIQ